MNFRLYTPMIAVLAAAQSPHATASGSPYSFGGNCPSQGTWTQQALQQSKVIADAITQLKDNPHCQGIEKVLLGLQGAQSELAKEAPESEAARESELESFPAEMNSLKQSLIESGGNNNLAASMLVDRTLRAASISADLSSSSRNASTKPARGSAAALTNLFNKIKAPTELGLDMISSVMQALPSHDRCLIKNPRQGMAILGGVIKTAAAYSAAGAGVGNKLGNLVMNLATMARDREFSRALRELDQVEFWFSVSCMLESTAKNYCEAETAQETLKFTKDRYAATVKQTREGNDSQDPLTYDNPLEGYYLMVRDLPVISTWLQKVQFGATPRLRSDAGFKDKIWLQVTDMTIKTNDITGYFNEQMIMLRELDDLESKQNQLFSMLDNLTSMLSGSGGDGQSADSAVFFNTTINPTFLPFFLIGRTEIPPECRAGTNSGGGGTFIVPPMDYIKTSGPGGKYVAEFKNPMELAEKIEQKMQWVIGEAGKKASNYFRERLIVDTPNLVNQTLSSQYLTVEKAFKNVYNYLVRFEKKIIADKTDLRMIPSIRETKVKIKKVLNSYDELRKLGEKMVLSPTSVKDDQLSPSVKTAAKKVIDTVFDEFNMLLQKDSFLTGRLATFIQKDFQLRIRKGQNMTAYQQDILNITQQHLLDKLISVHGLNPTSSERDLFQAQIINKTNLNVVEEFFKDTMYRMIVQMKAIADGRGEEGVREILKKKLNNEAAVLNKVFSKMPTPGMMPFMFTPGMNPTSWLVSRELVKNQHRDLFKQHKNNKRVVGIDDKFGSYAQVQAGFCAQTLAFEDREFFRDVCAGTVVKSYYSDDTNKKNNLDLRYDDYLPKGKAAQIRRSPELTSQNICAMNKFSMRGLVQWMKNQDDELLEDDTIQ